MDNEAKICKNKKGLKPFSHKKLRLARFVLDLLHAHGDSPVVLTHKPSRSVRYPDLCLWHFIRPQIRRTL